MLKITIKKLIYKYKYLSTEYEETTELFSHYLHEFNEYFKQELNDYLVQNNQQTTIDNSVMFYHNLDINKLLTKDSFFIKDTDTIPVEDVKDPENIPDTNLEQDIIPEVSKKNNLVKKLYHLISIVTHPDKTDDIKRNQLFLLSQLAYQENDLMKLIIICNDLHIIIPTDYTTEDLELINQNIDNLSNQITKIHNKLAWIWYHKNTEEREMIKQQLYQLWNIN